MERNVDEIAEGISLFLIRFIVIDYFEFLSCSAASRRSSKKQSKKSALLLSSLCSDNSVREIGRRQRDSLEQLGLLFQKHDWRSRRGLGQACLKDDTGSLVAFWIGVPGQIL